MQRVSDGRTWGNQHLSRIPPTRRNEARHPRRSLFEVVTTSPYIHVLFILLHPFGLQSLLLYRCTEYGISTRSTEASNTRGRSSKSQRSRSARQLNRMRQTQGRSSRWDTPSGTKIQPETDFGRGSQANTAEGRAHHSLDLTTSITIHG